MTDPVLFLQDMAVILISASLAGYVCRRIGLTPVVGYITAGLLVGTPEVVFPYVTDQSRIAVIAQLGLVFLMFSIGLQFRLGKIRALGFRVVVSTAVAAFFVLGAVRLSAAILHLSIPAGIALAAVFMNSSSAIISKIIQETGIGHERHGQLALSTTLLEDVVAVVMLAALGSYVGVDGDIAAGGPAETIGLLVGFAMLVFILGSLLIPNLLGVLGMRRNPEALSIFVAGVLLLAALIAVNAGYSLALGAFLCGMVVAQTQEKSLIERSFQGLKDIFLTVFFVTIGMMVNVQAIPGEMKWVLLGILGALAGRAVAAFVSLLLVGEHPRTAMRAALCLTPLGEFSFIIAGVAVGKGLFSERFQAVVVGTVLGTSLLSPLIARNGRRLTRFVAEGRLPLLDRAHAAYSEFWRSSRRKRKAGALWPLLRRRLFHIGVALLLLSTVLIFAGRLFRALRNALPGLFAHPSAEVAFWVTLGLVCTVPVIAAWRNLSATALILAEHIRERKSQDRRSALLLSGLLRLIFALLLLNWIWNILPPELSRQHVLAATALLAIPMVFFSWRAFVRIYREVEWLLDPGGGRSIGAPGRHLLDRWKGEEWDLNVREFTLPDDSPVGGMTLKNLALRKATGCSVVGIQRHGYSLVDIGATTQLFPGDELLLLGTDRQIQDAENLLAWTGPPAEPGKQLESQVLKSMMLPEGSPASGKRLGELQWTRDFGVQVVAVMRDGATLTGLDASTHVRAGDVLLLLGAADRMEELADANSTEAAADSA
ncbi:MAG: cation:proton antiporter [bacterium]|nr:cation:proton antiporter [bacterium]